MTTCSHSGPLLDQFEIPEVKGWPLANTGAVVNVCGPSCCSVSSSTGTSRPLSAAFSTEHAELAMEPREKSQEEKKKGKESESANTVSMISPIYKAFSLKLEGLHSFFLNVGITTKKAY